MVFLRGLMAVLFIFLAVMLSNTVNKAWGAHTEKPEVSPDVLVTFGCFDEQVTLNLQAVWETRGNYWYSEVANQYVQNEECFLLTESGYPAYIDRVVKKAGKKFKDENAYVVEAHFLGASPGKTFFLLYYGELPVRASRSAV